MNRWISWDCRLPTEAEWEYAARANQDARYVWGDGAENALKFSNINLSAGVEGLNSDIEPVRLRLPNNFGIYDMEGNAAEWVYDIFERYDDGDKTGRSTDATHVRRVVRGSSASEGLFESRIAFRRGRYPGEVADFLGFRVCAERSLWVGRD